MKFRVDFHPSRVILWFRQGVQEANSIVCLISIEEKKKKSLRVDCHGRDSSVRAISSSLLSWQAVYPRLIDGFTRLTCCFGDLSSAMAEKIIVHGNISDNIH